MRWIVILALACSLSGQTIKTGITVQDGVIVVANGTPLANVFVSPNGNDSWDGTAPSFVSGTTGPVLTPGKAFSLARSVSRVTSPIIIMFEGGTYYLCSALPCPLAGTNGVINLTSSDNGTSSAQVIFTNYPGSTPVIDGGYLVASWSDLGPACGGSCEKWAKTMPAGTVPFEVLWYNGQRRVKNRGSSLLGTWLRMNTYVQDATNANGNCPHIVGASPDHVCFDRFKFSGTDIVDSTNIHSVSSGSLANPCTAKASNNYPDGDVEITMISQFVSPVMRIKCVDSGAQIVYFTGPMYPISRLTANNFVFFAPVPQHRYLVENQLPNDLTANPQSFFLDRSTNPPVLTYYAAGGENPNSDTVVVPQAPTSMGGTQWASTTGYTLGQVVYPSPDNGFFYMATTGGTSGGSQPSFSTTVGATTSDSGVTWTNIGAGGDLILGSGLQYVTFSGLTFQHDNWTIPPLGYQSIPLQTGIPTLLAGQSSALTFTNAINFNFSGNTLQQTSGAGLQIFTPDASGATHDNTVTLNTVQDIGGAGITIGKAFIGTDTTTNIPHDISVTQNLVNGVSRIVPGAALMDLGDERNNTYSNNDVTDGYHDGIKGCDNGCPTFSNNTYSFNHIWNTKGVVGDGGALYIHAGNTTTFGAGNVITNNIASDIGNPGSFGDANPSGGHCIYLDNNTGNATVSNNLCYRSSGNSLFQTAGPNTGVANYTNTAQNNIFALSRLGIFGQGAPSPWIGSCPGSLASPLFDFEKNIVYMDKTAGSSPTFYLQNNCAYSCGLPYTSYQFWDKNTYFNTATSWATYNKAFHVEVTGSGSAANCTNGPNNWACMTSTVWKSGGNATLNCGTNAAITQAFAGGEDVHSAVSNPNFVSPGTCSGGVPVDNWNFSGSPPANFTAINFTLAGRTSWTSAVNVIPDSLPVTLYNPCSDY